MSGIEELLAGRTLVKRYRIEEVIGRGGFAAVYRAVDENLGRPVAVKVITLAAPDAAARDLLHERFHREARAAARLQHHPNVVTVHDFGTDPELGLDFLVMELLRGEDLATHLRRAGKPPLDAALHLLREAAEGVAVGHRAALVHRDVKPGNIFLAEPADEGPVRVCVLDFGIARILTEEKTLTRPDHGGAPLSPAYASPEQLRGGTELTPASDVFSLGVVGYQLLTGEKPFPYDRRRGTDGWKVQRSVRELNPEVPPAVESVLMRALAYEPEDRFPDAAAFATALDAAPAEDDRTQLAPVSVVAAAPGADEDHTELHPGPPPRRAPAAAPARSAPVRWWPLAVFVVVAAALAAWWATDDGAGGGAVEEPAAAVVVEDAPETAEGEGGEPAMVEGARPEGAAETTEPVAPPVVVEVDTAVAPEVEVSIPPPPDTTAGTLPEEEGAIPPPAPEPRGSAPPQEGPKPDTTRVEPPAAEPLPELEPVVRPRRPTPPLP